VTPAAPLPASAPIGIDIASIDVHPAVGSVGLIPGGARQAPAPGPGCGVPG
jgi:hypothetical protein